MSIIVTLGFLIALWVYNSNRLARMNQLFVLLVVFPLLNVFFSYISGFDISRALLWSRAAWFMGSLSVLIIYFFIIYFPRKIKNFIILDWISVCVWSIFAYLSLLTDYIVADATVENHITDILPGMMMDIFYVFVVLFIMLSILISINKYKLLTESEKVSMKYFYSGLLIFVISSVVFSIILPGVFDLQGFTAVGDYSIVLFFGFAAYAIVKRHLFDVRLAVVRSATYTLVLVSLACLYLDIVFIISGVFNKEIASPSQIASGVVTSLILAFVFQPLKRFFDKVTNKIFYKDNYDTDDFFTRVNESLTTTTDLRNLLERISHEIGNTLKSEQTFFYINTDDEHYVMAGTQHHRQLPKADADKLGELCGKSGDIVIASMLEPEDEVRRLMLSHRIELILPLIESNNIIGYLCLGEHRSNSGYTNRDVKALNAVSDEIAIAIQNALAVQEIREFNSTLQQRIENATKELRASNSILRQLDKTKDEFVGMASHQLRTPLTSVKGYISMVLEGDAGKVSDMQRKFLEEAFMSSERMVRLIDDFLNVSRIQNGKFIIDKHEVDLSKVVEQEIESLAPSAKMRNMKFVYNPPSDFPMIKLDEGKIRQVIMNFADNALYYSRDNTKIVIDLSVDRKDVVFTVKDTGIGVPISEQAQLFTKFYRASNARKQRPDGTGVGLYLAKKVIDAHGGEVIFLSIEGKGSMFGFRLPIDQVIESTTAS